MKVSFSLLLSCAFVVPPLPQPLPLPPPYKRDRQFLEFLISCERVCAQLRASLSIRFLFLLLYYFCCQKHNFNKIRFRTTALDAAHINQFKKGGSNHPTNGIAKTRYPGGRGCISGGLSQPLDELGMLTTYYPVPQRSQDPG